MKHVELCEVTFSHGAKPALCGLSASFTKNKVTAVLGQSGSGKSTLLQIILGLLEPQSGEVLIDGQPLNYERLKDERFRIGYVVQGNGLFPHLTVRENISIPGKFSRMSNKSVKARASGLLEIMGYRQSFGSLFPYQLTAEDQQRVAICRALFLDPPILLMDEPFGMLEVNSRRALHNEFKRLQERAPRTVVIVTHDLLEVSRLADKILVIDKGQLQQVDNLRGVMGRPANLQVQHLIEASLS